MLPEMQKQGRSAHQSMQLAEVCCLAVVVLVPLVFNPVGAYVFAPVKVSLFRSLALVGLLVALLDGTWRTMRLVQQSLAVPVLFKIAAWGAATIFSIDPGLSFWGRCSKMMGTYTFISYVMVWATVASYVRSGAQVDRLLTAVRITGGLVAVCGLIQSVEFDPFQWQSNFGSRIFSTLGHPNALGGYLAMTIPITAASFFMQSHPRRWPIVVLLMSQIAALARSGGRASMLAVAIGLLTLGGVYLYRLRHWRRVTLVAVGVILCTTLATLVILSPKIPNIFQLSRSNTIISRLLIWRGSLKLAAQRPIVGFGPDAFGFAFQSVYPPELAHVEGYGVIPDRAHNLLLNRLVATGALGLAASICVGGAFYARSLSAIRRADEIPWRMASIIGAITAYVVHSMFHFEVVATGALLWTLLGLSSALLGRASESGMLDRTGIAQKISSRPFSWGGQVVLMGIVLLGVLLGNVRFNISNVWRGRGQRAFAAEEWGKGIAYYSKASSLCPECNEDLSALGGVLLQKFRTSGVSASLQTAEEVLRLAKMRRPYDATPDANLGHLYLSWGRQTKAMSAYRRAISKRPFYPQYYDYLALAHQKQGNIKAAHSSFERALKLDPIHVPTYVRLGELEWECDDPDLAETYFISATEAYEAWVRINPGVVGEGAFLEDLRVVHRALAVINRQRGDLPRFSYHRRALMELESRLSAIQKESSITID